MKQTTAWMVLASLLMCAGSLAADSVETIFFRQNMATANEVPPVEGAQASARAQQSQLWRIVTFNLTSDVRNGGFPC